MLRPYALPIRRRLALGRPAPAILFSVALGFCCGCAGTGVSRIFHPGPAAVQQAEAEKFDPFPSDTGPDMAARPLSYIQQAPLAQRAQDALSFQERFGQAPPPGMYKVPGARKVQQIPYTIPLPPPPLPQQQVPVLPPPPGAPPFNP
jgi:hypothetical protein